MLRHLLMPRHLVFLLVLAAVCLPADAALAIGTPAGTDIANQATVTYTIAATNFVASSNVAIIQVDMLLNVSVVWQDAGPVAVNPGDTAEILTFLVTNTGNGDDTFDLAVDNSLGGDDFDPVFVDIYLDVDGDGIFNPASDDIYVSGTNDPALAADGAVFVFVTNDIPGALSNGDEGDSQFTASSNTGTGAPGTVIPGAGPAGVDAMVGTTGAAGAVAGTYRVIEVVVAVVKSVEVLDPYSGTVPMPGATLTYTLVVTASGPGTAGGIVLTDALPANTTYETGSLTLNTASLTDAADADAGDVGVTTPGTVTVTLGDLTQASPALIVTFAVTID